MSLRDLTRCSERTKVPSLLRPHVLGGCSKVRPDVHSRIDKVGVATASLARFFRPT